MQRSDRDMYWEAGTCPDDEQVRLHMQGAELGRWR